MELIGTKGIVCPSHKELSRQAQGTEIGAQREGPVPAESLGRDEAGSELAENNFATSQALLLKSVQMPKPRRWNRCEHAIYM